MDLFDLRDQVVGEYAKYVTSLFTIRDDRIRALVASRDTDDQGNE